MLDEYFKTTDYNKLKITNKQENLIEKNIELVKGSDFHKNFYEVSDINVVQKINVRFYQIAIFDEFEKCTVRSFLFEGQTSKGACFFDYKIIELKDYNLSKTKINKFVRLLDKQKKKNNNKFKLMYKFYSVYNFDYTNPPTGNDINECMSELLK